MGRRYRRFRSIQARFRHYLTILTFPGVVAHEYAHKRFAERYNMPIEEVSYFQLDDDGKYGYVKHGVSKRFTHNFFIAFAPLLLNSLFAFLSFLTIAAIHVESGLPTLRWPPSRLAVGTVLIGWFGVSCALHAIPSDGDADNVLNNVKRQWYNPLAILSIPFVLVIKLVNRLNVLGLDIVYAAGVAGTALVVARRVFA